MSMPVPRRMLLSVAMMMLASVIVPVTVLVLCLLLPEFFAWQLFLSGNDHVNFGRTDAAAVHTGDFQMRVDAQSLDGLLQQVRRNSGVHQRAQKHIAADPGEAF